MLVERITGSICMIWAGVVLGGSLVVAPAKFQVQNVPVTELVTIGRVQFEWLRNAESIVCLIMLLSSLPLRKWYSYILLVPALALAAQVSIVLPELRSETVTHSSHGLALLKNMHLLYQYLDLGKMAGLITIGLALIAADHSEPRQITDLNACNGERS